MRMAIRCSPPGVGRAATSCASSMPSTMCRPRGSVSTCRASTCSTTAPGAHPAAAGAGRHPRPAAAGRTSAAGHRRPSDRSIVFHVAHSAQREVEILHDQLLRPAGAAARRQPHWRRATSSSWCPTSTASRRRSARSSASMRAATPRHIPWGIADQAERGHQPLLVALEWLLRAPQQRFGASEVRDLLDVPAVARRFGLARRRPAHPGGMDRRRRRALGPGRRAARAAGPGRCGEPNTWAFGLRRMLLGYATGDLPAADGYAGIEPYAEVAGLEAGAGRSAGRSGPDA